MLQGRLGTGNCPVSQTEHRPSSHRAAGARLKSPTCRRHHAKSPFAHAPNAPADVRVADKGPFGATATAG